MFSIKWNEQHKQFRRNETDNLHFFPSETSNLSGLKAAKPTTFAKPNPNPNPKLNPNPKQHDQFKSSENVIQWKQ